MEDAWLDESYEDRWAYHDGEDEYLDATNYDPDEGDDELDEGYENE